MIIQTANLNKTYSTKAEAIHALKNINLQVQEGDFISITGHSGAGKTTMLNLFGCLDNISEGELRLLQTDMSKIKKREMPEFRRKNIGIIFQDFLFIPTLTALENVILPLNFQKKKDKNAEGKAKKLLDRVGMGNRLHHFPKELSGGELQRVAIARSLINSPKILLADEPTGNLDTKNAQNIFELLKEINEEQKMTILVATHNMKLGKQTKRQISLEDGKIVGDNHGIDN